MAAVVPSVNPPCAGDRALTKSDAASDPELARVLTAWPSLSDPIKAAILALVNTATPAP